MPAKPRKAISENDLFRKVRQVIIQSGVIKKKEWYLAYSAGIDSAVLLAILKEIVKPLSVKLKILHVNHNIRSMEEHEKDERLAIIEALSDLIPLIVYEIDRSSWKQQDGLSFEEKARLRRYSFFRQFLHSNSVLFTAHHQDDEIESYVMSLFKSSKASAALNSMELQLLRPLLNVSKGKITDFAEDFNIIFNADISNQDNSFERNKFRNEIIPFLNEKIPGFKKVVLSQIERSRQEKKSTDNLIDTYFKDRLISSISENRFIDSHSIQEHPSERSSVIYCIDANLWRQSNTEMRYSMILACHDQLYPDKQSEKRLFKRQNRLSYNSLHSVIDKDFGSIPDYEGGGIRIKSGETGVLLSKQLVEYKKIGYLFEVNSNKWKELSEGCHISFRHSVNLPTLKQEIMDLEWWDEIQYEVVVVKKKFYDLSMVMDGESYIRSFASSDDMNKIKCNAKNWNCAVKDIVCILGKKEFECFFPLHMESKQVIRLNLSDQSYGQSQKQMIKMIDESPVKPDISNRWICVLIKRRINK